MDREKFTELYYDKLNNGDTNIDIKEFRDLNLHCISHDDLCFNYEDKKIQGLTSLIIVMEELSELQKEVSKLARGRGNKINLLEEMADVSIVLERLKVLMNIQNDELNAAINVKIDRFRDILAQEDLVEEKEVVYAETLEDSRIAIWESGHSKEDYPDTPSYYINLGSNGDENDNK